MPVDLVDEEQARVPGAPGAADDEVPELAGLDAAHGSASAGVHKRVSRSAEHCAHEAVGDSDGEVEVGEVLGIGFGGDELLHVRMIDAEHTHHGTPALSAGFDYIGHRVENAHEGERSRCNTAGGAHHIAGWAQA